MTLQQKIFAVLTGLVLLGAIIHLVKKGRLKEEYSWLWLLTGVLIMVLALWYDALLFLTGIIGAVLPTTTLFIFGMIFLILLCLHFAIRISSLTDQVKNLAQKVSILEADRACEE